MAPGRAPLGNDEMIVAAAFVEMRRFGEADRGAAKNDSSRADQLVLAGRVFLHDNAGEAILARAMVPEHVEEVLAAIFVMKQRRIEAAAVQIDRLRPVVVDAVR